MKFIASNNDPSAPRERITGRQRVVIEQALFGPSKFDPDAQCFTLECVIKAGQFHGRKLWVHYFHSGKSDGKLAYDRRMLSDLVYAVGLTEFEVDEVTGEIHALRGKEAECDIGPKAVGNNDEPKKWHRDRVVPTSSSHDVSRRGGQLAAVAGQKVNASSDDFDGDMPF
jgi:hypothetical protein